MTVELDEDVWQAVIARAALEGISPDRAATELLRQVTAAGQKPRRHALPIVPSSGRPITPEEIDDALDDN